MGNAESNSSPCLGELTATPSNDSIARTPSVPSASSLLAPLQVLSSQLTGIETVSGLAIKKLTTRLDSIDDKLATLNAAMGPLKASTEAGLDAVEVRLERRLERLDAAQARTAAIISSLLGRLSLEAVAAPTAMPAERKRALDDATATSDHHLWADFDPTDDVDGAIARWASVQERIDALPDPAERLAAQRKLDSALPLLRDFFADQYAGLVVVLDVETTTLASEPIEALEASVCTVAGFDPRAPDDPERARVHSFWHRDARRLPMALVPSVLEEAAWVVAYNGSFDFRVLKREYFNFAAYETARAKLLDPFVSVARETGLRLKLAALLDANPQLGAGKTGSGADAPMQWSSGQLQALLEYNRQDVLVLKTAVLAPRLRLPTSDGRAEETVAASLAHMIAKARSTDPRDFVQGSSRWHAYRREGARITASLAPALLGFSPFLRPTEAFEALLGETMPANEHTRRGQDEEGRIAAALARRTGWKLREVGIYPHAEVGWLAASPDRLVAHSGEVVEIKSVSRMPTSPSDAHLMQLTIQLACVGAKIGLLAYRATGSPPGALAVWRLRYDQALFKHMVDLLAPLHAAAAEALRLGEEDETSMPLVPRGALQELRDLLHDVRATHLIYNARV